MSKCVTNSTSKMVTDAKATAQTIKQTIVALNILATTENKLDGKQYFNN